MVASGGYALANAFVLLNHEFVPDFVSIAGSYAREAMQVAQTVRNV